MDVRTKLIEEIIDASDQMTVLNEELQDETQRLLPFYPGDVVKLRSGGPSMTVHSCVIDGKSGVLIVKCWWFDTFDRFKEKEFPVIFMDKVITSTHTRSWKECD